MKTTPLSLVEGLFDEPETIAPAADDGQRYHKIKGSSDTKNTEDEI